MYRVEGRRPVGRPRRTWLESVEVYEEEVQPYWKTDYKLIIYIYIIMALQEKSVFPSFSPLIALTISSIVGFSSRAVLTLRFCMFSSTSGSMSQEH